LLHFGGGVGYLSDGVVLQLYGVFSGKDQTGLKLLFQRVGVDGSNILSDVMLDLIPLIT
jgi:hypothetical protein